MVEWSPSTGRTLVGVLANRRAVGLTLSCSADQGLHSSEHKLLDPPPFPLKSGSLKRGIRGLEIKTFVGGSFCLAK